MKFSDFLSFSDYVTSLRNALDDAKRTFDSVEKEIATIKATLNNLYGGAQKYLNSSKSSKDNSDETYFN